MLRLPNRMRCGALAARLPAPRQPPDPQQFLYDSLPFAWRKVRRHGIVLFNIHYWDDILSVWAGQLANTIHAICRGSISTTRTASIGRFARVTSGGRRSLRGSLAGRGRRARPRARRDRRAMIFDAIETQRLLIVEAAAETKSARRAV
jgi:putative transposase